METDRTLRIGELARAAHIGVDTVRFYEKQGLLPPPARTVSGYRQYDSSAVRQLRFVQAAKNVGFTLREVRELLSLRVSEQRSCADVKSRALAKLDDVDAKIAELERVRRALSRLADACAGRPVAQCALLDALDDEGAKTP